MSAGPACVCGRRKNCPKACPLRRLARGRNAPEATAAPVIPDAIDAQPIIERQAQAHGWDFSPYDYNPTNKED